MKRHHSKKPRYSSFVVRKKHLFMVVRGKLRTCDTSKMVLFCENSLPFKVVNNFEKKLHFKIYCRTTESALGIFSNLHLLQTFFLLLRFLNINGMTTLQTNMSLTTGIPQECLSCRLDVLVNFEQIFTLFWYFYC